MLTSYKDLVVWQKSIDLVVEVYTLTRQLPKSELYGIVSQMRRAAISMPSNIAEGYSRKHKQEYAQFIRIALASAAELETQIIICKRLGYMNNNFLPLDDLLTQTMKMLRALNKALKT